MDHTYTTIRVPVAASVKEVISAVADKLGSGEGLIIVKMSSGGGNSLISTLGFCKLEYPMQTEALPGVSMAFQEDPKGQTGAVCAPTNNKIIRLEVGWVSV